MRAGYSIPGVEWMQGGRHGRVVGKCRDAMLCRGFVGGRRHD